MALPHPQSYGLSVPYATTLMRFVADPGKVRKLLAEHGMSSGTPQDRTRAIAQTILEAGLDELPGIPGSAEGHAWVMGQFTMAQVYCMFCASGRIVYDFDPDLTAAFSRSDPGDTRVEDLRLPNRSFYLRFRSQQRIELPGGRELDGCYVFTGHEDKFIGLLLVPVRDGWPDLTDTGISGDIECTPSNALLTDALDAGLAKMESIFARQIAGVGLDPSMVDTPDLDRLKQDNRTIKSLLGLVCNALLFMSAYPEDLDVEWPEGAPAELVARATKGSLKKMREAYDELWSLGYTKTHFAGRRKAADLPARSHDLGAGRASPEGHWRRGHWRRQAHGPERSLRRPIWILPVWIGDEDVEPRIRRGRIVHVEQGER